jgi:uncharacterized protein YjbI with pentapeptide repeats
VPKPSRPGARRAKGAAAEPARRPPELRLPAEPARHDGSPLEPEHDYDGVAFAEEDFGGSGATGIRFLSCTFTGCTMTGLDLTGSVMRELRIERLRAVGTEFVSTGWLDVEVSGSLLAGPLLYDATLERVVFRDCKLDAANFRDATLTDVTFEGCSLTDADFSRATMRRVGFPGSRLAGADFTKADLGEVDLRGCELGIERGLDSLGGAIVDQAQLVALAPVLAAHLGIEVRDHD